MDNNNEVNQTFNAGQKPDILDKSNISSNKRKKKKSHPILVLFLIILSFVIGVGGSYYYFEVFNNTDDTATKKEKTCTKKETKEEYNPDGLYIKNLISRYDYEGTSSNINIYNNLYKSDQTLVKDIDSNYLKVLSAKIAATNAGSLESFDENEYSFATKLLFGSDIVFDAESIKYDDACVNIEYSDGIYNYSASECGGVSNITMERKIIKAETTDDNLYVTVAVGVLDYGNDKVYIKYDAEGESEELENTTTTTFDIDNDYAKLNKYKYTFNYDSENNNYYLVSIELVEE